MDFEDLDNHDFGVPFITPNELTKLLQTDDYIKCELKSVFVNGEFADCLKRRVSLRTVANDPVY